VGAKWLESSSAAHCAERPSEPLFDRLGAESFRCSWAERSLPIGSNMGSLVTVLFGAAVGVGIVLGLWLLADLVTDLQRHVHGHRGR
jgi:hypothetical protein